MYELTADLFIKVLNANGVKIQGGTIHDFLKNCSIDFFLKMNIIFFINIEKIIF